MNIFKHASDFIGEINLEKREGSLQELFSLVAATKKHLDKKGYLLDAYLSLFMEMAGSTSASDTSDWTFQKYCEFWRLCHTVVERTEEMKKHPLYAATRKTFLTHDEYREFQEDYTQKCLLYVAMSDQFVEHAVKEFLAERERVIDVELEILRLNELFQMITGEIGEEKMDELNLKLKEKLIIAQPITIVFQCLADELMALLTTRDIETNMMIFQLVEKQFKLKMIL